MSIAEAQGAGVGVCMANIRPDLREYVGPAGFFVQINQPSAKDHIQPFPVELRETGFDHAKKSETAYRCLNFGGRRVQLC